MNKGCGKIFRIEGFGLACGEMVEGDLFLCRKCQDVFREVTEGEKNG